MYIYVYVYLYIHTYIYPLDRINHAYSLSCSQISGNHFTYHSEQIFKCCAKDRCSKIWSSAQDYAVAVLLLNMIESLISTLTKIFRRKWFVPVRYQLPKGKMVGIDLQYLYVIRRFGWIYTFMHIHTYINTHMSTYIHVYIYMYIYTYVCIYINVYIYIYKCINVYIYMWRQLCICRYIHTRTCPHPPARWSSVAR